MSDVVTLTKALEQHALSLVGEAGTLVIQDPLGFAKAGEMLRAIKSYLLKVEDVLGPVIRATHAAHKTAVEQKNRLEAPALEAERRLKSARVTYQSEQKRLEEAARAVAQRERERLEAEATIAAATEADRPRKQTEEERLERALAAEAQGDTALAERLVAEPIPEIAPRPVVVFTPTIETPELEGTFRQTWKGEVTDFAFLVKSVAAQEAPLTLLKIDQVALNGLARALKGSLNIPGVRAVAEVTEAVRA